MKLDLMLRRWRRVQFLALGLRALGVALGAGALTWVVAPPGPWRWLFAILFGLHCGVLSARLRRPPMADPYLLASYLDRQVADLEDSTDLALRDPSELTGVERLQAQRVNRVLSGLSQRGLWPRAQMARAARVFAGGVVVVLLIVLGQFRWSSTPRTAAEGRVGEQSGVEATTDPLERLEIEIHPPAYTGLPVARQVAMDIEAPEGSRLRWRLPAPLTAARLEFAVGGTHEFQPVNGGIVVELEAWESDVYRLWIEQDGLETPSEYARFVVQQDSPPDVRVVEPAERVTLVEGSAGRFQLSVEVEDDYGLDQVELISTLAQGSGEQVEFRQRRQGLDAPVEGRWARLQTDLDVSALDLQAGSELYLLVEARDNRQPRANIGRSATYIVRIPGERLVSADLGEGLPIVLPPEYFRSQRQIIIDTEKLMAEEPDLSVQEFQRRSESLGFDQRALRMRYGTLLGEEFESGRPVVAAEVDEAIEDEHGHESASQDESREEAEAEAPLQGVLSEFGHSHDSAEIATFFTSDTRSQLKQVLAQMWDAEGRLRLHRPQQALPYEYRALELLKDLQQRSRIYVQKVGFETPPLEPEKLRLTGDLEEIENRSRLVAATLDDPLSLAVGQVLAALGTGASAGEPPPIETLITVRVALAQAAAREPELIPALSGLDALIGGSLPDEEARGSVREALWRLLPEPAKRPGRAPRSTDPLAEVFRAVLSEEEP